jgi:hypothetical protein
MTSAMRSLLLSLIALSATAVVLSAKPDDLTSEQQKQLDQDKIIVTENTWRQIFTPYIFAGQPVFITSDSVLHAYHVLLEESIAQMESQQALRMAGVLDAVLAQINPDTVDGVPPEAVERAQLLLGTAARLVGSHWGEGTALDAKIAAEVKRVEAAEGLHLPAWMKPGHGLVALDYRVFKPAGFYTRSASLQRYFRALRWMQTVPLRLQDPAELEAARVLGEAVWEEGSLPVLASLWTSLSGAATTPALCLLKEFRRPSENVVKAASRGADGEVDKLFVFPSAALPDAKLMERTTNPRRPYPDPLDIGAWLGSPLALQLLKTEDDTVIKAIGATPGPSYPASLYGDYLGCLTRLLEAPEPDAPPFMGTPPWERKSLNTALSGWALMRHAWALMRHAWALQAEEDSFGFPADEPYPGFVEPVPVFFHALAQLILHTVDGFEELDALTPSPQLFAADAAALIPMVEHEADGLRRRMQPWLNRSLDAGETTEAEIAQLEKDCSVSEELSTALRPVAPIVEGLWPYPPLDAVTGEFDGDKWDDVTGVFDVDKLLSSLREIASGKHEAAFLDLTRKGYTTTLRKRWVELLSITMRLENRAHRQLRGIEPDGTEEDFMVNYGETLGSILFYEGTSYHKPRDDAPLATAVFNHTGGQFLIAGTGRPREIRVLYPWKGKEILCRGAIIPFHSELSDTHLTDKEWRASLDTAKPPASPTWLRPILSPDAPAKPPKK